MAEDRKWRVIPLICRQGGGFPSPLGSDPQIGERPGTAEGVLTHGRIHFVVPGDVLVDPASRIGSAPTKTCTNAVTGCSTSSSREFAVRVIRRIGQVRDTCTKIPSYTRARPVCSEPVPVLSTVDTSHQPVLGAFPPQGLSSSFPWPSRPRGDAT